jgi:23S rRNA (cytidine1920-2'-O)/16S rRNA (cytidine1409-2'-O)-methyltransferase
VGRGGEKLDGALARFALDVSGRRAVDLGASTGGFTDCLLQRGAASVVAVDVGYGQLHERLRADPRVEVHERTNVRDLAPGDLGPLADVLVADLSFISLRTVLPAALALAAPGADVVLLVKPQFEAGRQEAARGKGVITDPAIWRRVLGEVAAALDGLGAAIMGAMASPLTGADGNVEFLLHARTAPARPSTPLAGLLDAALAEADRRP